MPVYNAEKFLADAIESILHQAIKKEIILVDDGSTDNSLNIALDYAKRYPFVIVLSAANRGVSAARNRGLAVARGEFVLFLDPDDELTLTADFPQMYQLAKTHNANVVKGQYSRIRKLDTELYQFLPSCSEVKENPFWVTSLEQFFYQSLHNNWVIQIACFLLERQFLIRNQLCFDESKHYAEDQLFYIEMYCCNGTIIEVSWFTLMYKQRMSGATIDGNLDRRIEDIYQFTRFIHSKIESRIEPLLKDSLIILLALVYWELDRIITFRNKERTPPKYQDLITPEIKAFCQSYQIMLLA